MKNCPECNNPVNCGAGTGKSCWCSSFPPILPVDDSKKCLCTDCLKKLIQAEIALFVQEFKAGKRGNIAPEFSSPNQFVDGIDYYVENGYRVMTEWYHLKRGYCCRNGCRHCPYGFKKRES